MKVTVMSREAAKRHSYKIADKKYIIISITTPGDDINHFNDNPQIARIFRMSFYDITRDEGDIKAPTIEDVKLIKKVVDYAKSNDYDIVVHCDAGVSRSAATAMAIEEYLEMEDTIRPNPLYHPNYTVYDCVKAVLNEK